LDTPIISNGGLLQKDNDPANLKKIGKLQLTLYHASSPNSTLFKGSFLIANIDWRQGGEFPFQDYEILWNKWSARKHSFW